MMGVHPNITTEKFPRQGEVHRFAKVCVHYDKTEFEAICIRDDYEEPYLCVFLLSDGRVVLSTECQYRMLRDEEAVKSRTLVAVGVILDVSELHPAPKSQTEKAQ